MAIGSAWRIFWFFLCLCGTELRRGDGNGVDVSDFDGIFEAGRRPWMGENQGQTFRAPLCWELSRRRSHIKNLFHHSWKIGRTNMWKHHKEGETMLEVCLLLQFNVRKFLFSIFSRTGHYRNTLMTASSTVLRFQRSKNGPNFRNLRSDPSNTYSVLSFRLISTS